MSFRIKFVFQLRWRVQLNFFMLWNRVTRLFSEKFNDFYAPIGMEIPNPVLESEVRNCSSENMLGHVTFPVFWKFVAWKSISEIHIKMRRKWGRGRGWEEVDGRLGRRVIGLAKREEFMLQRITLVATVENYLHLLY